MTKEENKLKVALVCDWLTEVGGAEKVLLTLHRMFPDAPIYTSQYRPKRITWFRDATVKTGWLNTLPRGLRKFMAPLRACYFNHLDLSAYDLVISIANAEAKGIKTGPNTTHICYMQGPPTQYYWGQYDNYLKNPGFGKLNWLARLGLKLLVKPMRRSDYQAGQKPDLLLANSTYVAGEIKKYYGRESAVLFPPVDTASIRMSEVKPARPFGRGSYYVIAGRQVNWKRVDLAIAACQKMDLNLLVIGDGAEHDRLVEQAGNDKHIRFLPKYNGSNEIVEYFRGARGFIFPSIEPFGIVPVEALANGLPVIALRAGGALDMIADGKNGVFFDEQTTESLVVSLRRFNKIQLDRTVIKRSAEKFSIKNFEKRFHEIIRKNEGC